MCAVRTGFDHPPTCSDTPSRGVGMTGIRGWCSIFIAREREGRGMVLVERGKNKTFNFIYKIRMIISIMCFSWCMRVVFFCSITIL